MRPAPQESPAVVEMRRLAASPLMLAALFCMSGGLLYLFFVELRAVFSPHSIPSGGDPLRILHFVRDGMLLIEVVLLLLLLGGLWAVHLRARRQAPFCPARSFRWIHGVVLAEFVYEMLVLALELAANLIDAAAQPENAAPYLGSACWLLGIGAVTAVVHHALIGALNSGRETLLTGQPRTRHLSVTAAVTVFVLSAVAMLKPAAWLTALGEILLGVLLLKHRRNMRRLSEEKKKSV